MNMASAQYIGTDMLHYAQHTHETTRLNTEKAYIYYSWFLHTAGKLRRVVL